jgi:predicted nucleic acid-binding protein
MIVLDTNVVSELMRPGPDDNVLSWIDRHPAETVFVTATTLAELLAGLARLPEGRRRFALETALTRLRDRLFTGRILPFDQSAAEQFAEISARLRAKGRAISLFDAQIASVALAHGMSVATRDITPFVDAGLQVIDPWTMQPH